MGIDYFNFYELNSLQILLTLHKKKHSFKLMINYKKYKNYVQ